MVTNVIFQKLSWEELNEPHARLLVLIFFRGPNSVFAPPSVFCFLLNRFGHCRLALKFQLKWLLCLPKINSMICPRHEATDILTQRTGNKVHVSVKKLCIVLSHLNHGDYGWIRNSVNENQRGWILEGWYPTTFGRMTDPVGSSLKV